VVDSYHDVRTVNEVFCRQDYGDGTDVRLVVDIGANIGVASLFFLSRRPNVRVIAVEPAPRNLPRLRRHLAPFGDRTVIVPAAVGVASGRAGFTVETTGRYGHLARPADQVSVEVPVVDINALLRDTVASHGVIDLVKIDTEGTETELAAAIAPEVAARVRRVVIELPDGAVAESPVR
jgi:FkbM family methyltransferase